MTAPLLWSATVRVPIAPMHEEARVKSPMISQQLAGHRVDVIEERDEWLRVVGDDGYEGWIHQGFLARAPEGAARQSRHFSRISLGCVTAAADGTTRALPLRAVLSPEETLKSGEIIDANRLPDRFPPLPAAILETAQTYFAGSSYLWGGVTPWGADCSGLVQSTFALHGIRLPRDAWQQGQSGSDAGTDVAALCPADLLFFTEREDRKITHVGIAMGEERMVHMALGRGGFSIERLDDRTDWFVDRLLRRFLFARRVL